MAVANSAFEVWESHPIAVISFLIVTALFFKVVVAGVQTESKIKKLGGHAPIFKSKLPFSMDLIYNAIWYQKRNRDVEAWEVFFDTAGHKERKHNVELYVFGRRVIMTADEENLKAILATQFNDFGKGPRFHELWLEFLGDGKEQDVRVLRASPLTRPGIFNADGEVWHQSRQLLRTQFLKDRVSDLETFEDHSQTLLPMLQANGVGQPIDLDDLFFRFTLDAATDFLFGSSVDSLHTPTQKFADAFTEVQRVQIVMARAGPFKNLVDKKSFREALKVMDEVLMPYIEQTIAMSPEELEKETFTNGKKYTFLHALATYTRDKKVLRDQLVSTLLAGRDTTAGTLSWLFYHLSVQPETVAKLRKEIEEHVGWERGPTYADLKSMRYLQHAINETLRMYPVLPYNTRTALKDTTLPRGGGPDGKSPIGLLKGTQILYSPKVLQEREDIYNNAPAGFPDIKEFSPDRWFGWTPKSWTCKSCSFGTYDDMCTY